MGKFKIEYENGKTEVVNQSDCDTIEQFVNTKFGTVKNSAKVTVVGAKVQEPVVEKPKAEAKVVPKTVQTKK